MIIILLNIFIFVGVFGYCCIEFFYIFRKKSINKKIRKIYSEINDASIASELDFDTKLKIYWSFHLKAHMKQNNSYLNF